MTNDQDSPGIGDPSPGGDPLGTDPNQPGADSQQDVEVDPSVGIGQPPEMSFTHTDALQLGGLAAIAVATFTSASPAVAALGVLGATMMSADPLGTALGHAAQDLTGSIGFATGPNAQSGFAAMQEAQATPSPDSGPGNGADLFGSGIFIPLSPPHDGTQ